MNSIDQLLGETTTTGSIPCVATSPLLVARTFRDRGTKSKVARLLKRKQLKQEAVDDEPIIPGDAKPLVTVTGDEASSGKGSEKNGSEFHEPLIPTSVALVAPDLTPDSEVPLDPSQVPLPVNQPSAPVASSPTAPVIKDEGSVMQTLIGLHQEKFNPKLLDQRTNLSEAEINRMVESTVTAISTKEGDVAKAKAAKLLAEAQAGGKTGEVYYNPQAGAKAAAAMRAVLGDT
jgi:hypothetical protein